MVQRSTRPVLGGKPVGRAANVILNSNMDHDDNTTRAAPATWIKALDESDAQIAAGQTVPLEPLLNELRHAAAQLEQRLATRPERTAEPDLS